MNMAAQAPEIRKHVQANFFCDGRIFRYEQNKKSLQRHRENAQGSSMSNSKCWLFLAITKRPFRFAQNRVLMLVRFSTILPPHQRD